MVIKTCAVRVNAGFQRGDLKCAFAGIYIHSVKACCRERCERSYRVVVLLRICGRHDAFENRFSKVTKPSAAKNRFKVHRRILNMPHKSKGGKEGTT